MKKFTKLMTIMPLVVSMMAPLSVYAVTGYNTSEENVDYSAEITTDYNNESDVTKVDVTVAQTSTFTVSIPKKIVLNGAVGQTNDADYVIKVSGNIASDEIIHVTPPTNFKMHDDRGIKADLNTTITQTVTKFVNEEVKPVKYATDEHTIFIKMNNENNVGVTNGNVEVHNLTAGSWTGVFNFDIKLETVTFN